jgi:hypothetical protein
MVVELTARPGARRLGRGAAPRGRGEIALARVPLVCLGENGNPSLARTRAGDRPVIKYFDQPTALASMNAGLVCVFESPRSTASVSTVFAVTDASRRVKVV